MTNNQDAKVPSWEELVNSISTGSSHPEATCWEIYRYLRQNYKTIGSETSRTLLFAYIKLRTDKPSLINSCMMDMAVKISTTYTDFQLPRFLDMCNHTSCLRDEDRQKQKGKDGKLYLSLQERIDRALQSYRLHHPEARNENSKDIISMYAVSLFEKIKAGRTCRFVKMVAANGMSLIADSHQFPCRPYEIIGKVYDVSVTSSKEDNKRIVEIAASTKAPNQVFPIKTGYIDGIDETHGHIHIFDNMSHHYVADRKTITATLPARTTVQKGMFIQFCPIISNGDPFKSAAIVNILDRYKGHESFGSYSAKITYANPAQHYIRYTILSDIPTTPEGTISKEGFASTSTMKPDMEKEMTVGKNIQLILFLKRGINGQKSNHVAEIY